MNILLVGVNAKYIHSCLAVHSLSCYAKEQYGLDVQVAEYTINQQREFLLAEIWKAQPDLVGFSCYIWNMGVIRSLITELRLLMPHLEILLGGPEVSFDGAVLLDQLNVDYILTGEGEESFSRLCMARLAGTSLEDVPGLIWREEGQVRENPVPAPLDLAKLPFIYQDFSRFANRILYYEAQRGCPFQCQYCLSSVEKGVRFQPLEKVQRELLVFLENRVRQVKFVDRTFNADPNFAMAIWKFLHEHDNGVTNFHFELAAELLTEEMLDFLPQVRPGLFQFEIGVQSTYQPTLRAIRRGGRFELLTRKVRRLQQAGNIHLHLDLIAGLPEEDLVHFRQSFDDVYRLSPDQFQLGFLKLLKGSGLRRDQEKFGLVARQEPPYEILYTNVLSYGDLLLLKDVETLVDSLYNSCQFRQTLAWLISLTDAPFDFYQGMAAYFRNRGAFGQSLSRVQLFDLVHDYGMTLGVAQEELIWRLKFDFCSREKPRRLPDWMPSEFSSAFREAEYAFFQDASRRQDLLPEYDGLEPRQVGRMAHLEVFPFDPKTGFPEPTAFLFNYRRTDILGNATTTVVKL